VEDAVKRSSIRFLSFLFLFSFFLTAASFAQIESGAVNGTVTDPTGSAVVGAKVTITDIGTSVVQNSTTGEHGNFHFATLRPSHYRITVSATGFKEGVIQDIELHTQDTLNENIGLAVGSASDTVSVSAETEQIETSAAISTTVDRKFIENMPLNGRSFQALIALTPGNVTAKTYYTNSGQFSVNGQRTDANYFSIDGVSANVGITQGSNVYLGSAGGGAAQATSSSGGYNNLVSVDDMQEYKIQTSSFDAEYGRTTGAQLSIVTRSGTNKFHGTAFEYLRNEVFDANTWFNNNEGLARAAEKQNDFGGVVGGPIIRDKLFFFGSYEGLRLRVPESRQDTVPTTYARNLAPDILKPLLNAYPLPSAGQDIDGNYTGQFFTTFSNPSKLDATSVRLDYSPMPKLNLFVRGDYAPSVGSQYGAFDFYTRSTYSSTISNVDSITAGATYIFNTSLVDDFRFNVSHSKGATVVKPISFGGSTAPSDAYLFQSQPQYTTATSVFGVFFNDGTTDYYVGNDATNHQRQLNFVDTLSWSLRQHTLKFGADVRRLTPKNGYRPYDLFYSFADVKTLVTTGVPIYASIDSAETTMLRPIFTDLSFFAQDAWQVNHRLTLNFGLRWDYDGPPSDAEGHPLYTALNLESPADVALAPVGTPLWHASKTNFAPRAGFSYLIHDNPGYETVIRGGGGVFYGLGDEVGAQGTLGAPYTSVKYLYGTAGTYPLSVADATAAPLTTDPPYSFVFAFDPNLKDPKLYMWNGSLQQNLGGSRSLQISYVGNKGVDLLRNEMLQPSMGGNANFGYLDVTFNHDYSNYNSLQVQFKQNAWHHVQSLFSYTWSHALDNGSSLALPSPYHTVYAPSLDYGNSDLDVRNTFSNATSYEIQGTKGGNGAVKYASNGWALDSLFRSNSALPVNISTGQYGAFGLQYNNDAINQRPNVVASQPFYLSSSTAPGGRIFNPAAFTTPSLNVQGDLGRNIIRGFGAWQEDLAVRRSFPIVEGINLLFRAEAFNIFNHPLFGDPGTNDSRNLLTNQFFGISSHTLADSLGGGGADGGFSSLYQIGSPRSLQFAVKVQF
jgi:Carboxypeptidase regulatory-like domain